MITQKNAMFEIRSVRWQLQTTKIISAKLRS